ncbi:predicted protein [Histoplasma mississippiense (nom. inval.)]|uniref:predicted protein n=1 Tax=Ajellomyces capsulatus (strain NAm1 / WU24) TaxID=2059318 RepID=UPI000157B508|nr:predicted protein [Histoplasma mississippiense (nom. inval.)]EDN03055.1 predicted protein [Histoplasma mississippiense (nom. inval.)]
MVPVSCLAGSDKQSRSKTDVRSALNTLSVLDAIFSDSGSESGSVSNDEDDDDSQLPSEHYLALAESLNIAQLRQKWYSPRIQEKLDEIVVTERVALGRYCRHIKVNAERQWDRISNSEETVRFLYAFFSWRCDIRRGKNNRYCPGIKRKSSLETFWKWWHLVLKQEMASGLSKDTIVKVENMATEKELALVEQSKKNMYIEDVAEFAQVVLITTEMTFVCSWQCIQMLLFLQLAAITASRLSAILHLRNEFKIPEIIFDSTLILSLHICLLTLLFHIEGFKSILTSESVLNCAEKLYSVKMLDGKGQQLLLLKDELLDKFVFCQTEPTSTGFKICLDQRMTPSMVSSRMRRAGEITGFEEVAHPYNLRYVGAKAFTTANIMLQHTDIHTFIKHYQMDVDVDVQGIVRKTCSQTALVQFACSMSASIDPNRLYKLSPEESRSLNYLSVVRGRQDTVQKRKREWEDHEAELEHVNRVCKTSLGHLDNRVLAESNPEVLERLEVFRDQTAEAKSEHNKATCELHNKKQRQRNRQICENLEHYKNEQSVIDLERQLAGKLVDIKVMDTFEHEAFMPPEHLIGGSTQSTQELHSVAWRKGGPRAGPRRPVAGPRLMMTLVL